MTHIYRGTAKHRKALFQIERLPFLKHRTFSIMFFMSTGPWIHISVAGRLYESLGHIENSIFFNWNKSVNKKVQASGTKYPLQVLIKNIN